MNVALCLLRGGIVFPGSIALAFNPPFGGEVVRQLIMALTIGAPLFFQVLARYEIMRPTNKR